MRKQMTLAALVLGVSLGTSACVAEVEPAETSEDELRSDTATALEVEMFTQPSQVSPCYQTTARWRVDFVAGRLSGSACDAAAYQQGTPVTVDRMLKAAEITTLKKALTAVRTTPRPTVCGPAEAQTTFQVERGTRKTKYVARANACTVAGTVVADASVRGLLDALTGIAKKSDLRPIGAGLCGGRPCATLGGTCTDRSSGRTHTAFASIGFYYSLISSTSTIEWNGGPVAGGTAGDLLNEWLRNRRIIALDGNAAWTTNVSRTEHVVGRAQIVDNERIEFFMGTKSGNFSCELTAALQ